MGFLRNPEVRRTLILLLALSVAASAVALMWDARFGWFTAAVCAVLVLVHFLSTYRRYRRISGLSGDIDRILHSDVPVSLEKYAEGELGVLQSEIYKMTVRLREQGQRLSEDKVYLADSIADISHQIRTSLTSINLLVSILSDGSIPEERRIKLTHELYGLLSRIDWLITTLLKMSRLDAGTAQLKKEEISAGELIKKAAAPLLVAMELRGQELNVAAQGVFTVDVSWTCEALGNIVKNCMEHTPDGGRIEINARETALFSEITVSDNGGGIPKEDLPHIFERFYKGVNSGKQGFGIGLALARRVITAQNGTVKAENLASGGTRFTIRFYKGAV